jgi:hypothetical protein
MSSIDTKVDVAIKNFDRQLRDTQRFRRIARAVKPTTNSTLTKVEISTTTAHLHPSTGKVIESTTVKVIDTRTALEDAIIARNKTHFAQADGTPFTRSPLAYIGSANGYNVFADAGGREIRLPDSSFVETNTVLDLLGERQQDISQPWSEMVSFDEFISGLLHWKEKTSTSPSGRHLGLYRALVTAHCNSSGEFHDFDPNNTYKLTTQEMAEQILGVIHGLDASAARQGFYLRRWVNVVNVMIYKKPGCIELDKLRVIHLFEADFNMMVGILFGRRAMHHQVDNRLLNPTQFGRPGGECQDASISKVLHNLVCSFTHTPMDQFESNAKACFDREIM